MTDHALSPLGQQPWQPHAFSSGSLLRALQPLPVLVRSILRSATKLAFVTLADHTTAVTANGANFTLTGDDSAYLFHVDEETGELISDHFGGPADDFVNPPLISYQGWVCPRYFTFFNHNEC
jgi:hypothetical protein